MKIRQHRGSLTESLKTEREVPGREELVELIAESLRPFGMDVKPEQVHLSAYAGTHIITVDGYGVWGFADGGRVELWRKLV